MSSRLSELVAFKEFWENRKEKCEDAVKFYEKEITKEVQCSCSNGRVKYKCEYHKEEN